MLAFPPFATYFNDAVEDLGSCAVADPVGADHRGGIPSDTGSPRKRNQLGKITPLFSYTPVPRPRILPCVCVSLSRTHTQIKRRKEGKKALKA